MSTVPILGYLRRLILQAPESEWLGTFTRLEVWRSLLGPQGPYEEMTGPTWAPPRLPRGADVVADPPVAGPFGYLVGLGLDLLVNEDVQVSVVFTGVDPLTRADAAAQLSSASAGLLSAWVTQEGVLAVETSIPGSRAILRVLGGAAAGILGLTTQEPDSYAYGRDAWLTLKPGQATYAYIDAHSVDGVYYKTRYRDMYGAVSDFSAPIPGSLGPLVPQSRLACGFLDLVDSAGRPTANREVRVESVSLGLVDGLMVVGQTQLKSTNASGRVEFDLVRGLTVTVVIAGVNLARRVTVPLDASVERFNLLDPLYGTDDLFVVQDPNVDYAVRRTL